MDIMSEILVVLNNKILPAMAPVGSGGSPLRGGSDDERSESRPP